MKLYAEIREAIKKKPLHNPPPIKLFIHYQQRTEGEPLKNTRVIHTRGGVKTNKLY